MSSIIRIVIQIIVFIVIVVYLMQDIDSSQLMVAFHNYNIFGLFATIISVLLSYIVLSFRWKNMIDDKKCNLKTSFETMVISGFFNSILPARLGEASKLLYLKKYYNINISHSSSIIFIERLLDIIALVIFLAIANFFIVEHDKLKLFFIIFSLFAISILFLLKRKFVVSFLHKIPIRFINVLGRRILRNINLKFKQSFSRIILLTLLLWFVFFLNFYIFFGMTVDFYLEFYQIFVFFIISVVVSVIPITPSSIGFFQAGIVLAGNMFGVDKESSLLAGIVFQFLSIFINFVLFAFVIFLKKNYVGLSKTK